ncbi:hypothetical protein BH23CHL2_BH23CHL2_11320 [soil metagenome]
MSAARKLISSTSRSSPAHNTVWPERRHWFVATTVGVALIIGLTWLTTAGAGTPELRIAATNRAVSAQIVDGEYRVLILNARDPRDARAVIGKLAQPWEPRPSTIIVGADRDNASALWEAVHRVEPQQIIVAGAPGDSTDWSAIERYARERQIQVSFLEKPTAIKLDSTTITVSPPIDAGSISNPSFVEIGRSESLIAVELAGLPQRGRYHLSVSAEPPGPHVWANLAVTMDDSTTSGRGRSILLRPGERIDTIVEPNRLRIQGRHARDLQQH